ncbi:hypothetical protein TNCV_3447331 [Trichonephila clavipes]|nr:hypothetical protein TNCV_3447331 [Trichonephila clavipes]
MRFGVSATTTPLHADATRVARAAVSGFPSSSPAYPHFLRRKKEITHTAKRVPIRKPASSSKVRKCVSEGNFPRLEQCLVSWIRQCRGQNILMGGSLLKEKAKAFAKELGIEFSASFPSPNLVDVDDTLTEFNAEPSLWEALPEQDLMFDDYVLVDTDIAVWGALTDAEIVALEHNNTENDEEESEELTPVTLPEAKVSH